MATFTVGGHVISAVYAGDALHDGSTSTSVAQNDGQDAGANSTTDGGTSGTTDAGSKVDASVPPFDAAVAVDAGCGCSTAPTGSTLAVIPSVALFAALSLRRRSRKQDDATES